MSIRLVSVANVKTFLNINNTESDTLLDLLVKFNSQRIETYLNRQLKKEARTKYFNAGRKRYSLPAYPIDSAITLTVTDGLTTLTKDSDYYVWYDEGVVEFYSTPVAVEPKQIKIIWTGGYAETGASEKLLSVPDDMSLACILQTAYVFRRRNELGIQSVSLADGSVNAVNFGEFIPQVKGILKSYRRQATYDY